MKRIVLKLTDEQYKVYEDAAVTISDFSIPTTPLALIKVMVLNQDESLILSNHLKAIKDLSNEALRKIREKKEVQNDVK